MNKFFLMAFLGALLASNLAIAQSNFTSTKITIGEPVSSSVSVTFVDNSAVFKPTHDQIEAIGNLADAAMVTISGRTSTSKASARDEALALKRALAARKWLIEHGVSPLKVFVNFVSASDYIAENSTPEGRAQNQRVDVEVIFFQRF